MTPEKQENFFKALGLLFFLEPSAAAVDVHPGTVRAWIARGRLEPSGKYREFSDAYDSFRRKHEAKMIGSVVQAASLGSWQAAVTWLRTIKPARYGERIRVTIDQELNEAIRKLQRALPPEAYRQALRALAADDSGEGAGADGVGGGDGLGDEPDAVDGMDSDGQ